MNFLGWYLIVGFTWSLYIWIADIDRMNNNKRPLMDNLIIGLGTALLWPVTMVYLLWNRR